MIVVLQKEDVVVVVLPKEEQKRNIDFRSFGKIQFNKNANLQ